MNGLEFETQKPDPDGIDTQREVLQNRPEEDRRRLEAYEVIGTRGWVGDKETPLHILR